MEKVTLEMPLVAKCSVRQCVYNQNQNCHAKAITVGDSIVPGCDTFFEARQHAREVKTIAGVGACKVKNCAHNEDFECRADSIMVGLAMDGVSCLTYSARDA